MRSTDQSFEMYFYWMLPSALSLLSLRFGSISGIEFVTAANELDITVSHLLQKPKIEVSRHPKHATYAEFDETRVRT